MAGRSLGQVGMDHPIFFGGSNPTVPEFDQSSMNNGGMTAGGNTGGGSTPSHEEIQGVIRRTDQGAGPEIPAGAPPIGTGTPVWQPDGKGGYTMNPVYSGYKGGGPEQSQQESDAAKARVAQANGYHATPFVGSVSNPGPAPATASGAAMQQKNLEISNWSAQNKGKNPLIERAPDNPVPYTGIAEGNRPPMKGEAGYNPYEREASGILPQPSYLHVKQTGEDENGKIGVMTDDLNTSKPIHYYEGAVEGGRKGQKAAVPIGGESRSELERFNAGHAATEKSMVNSGVLTTRGQQTPGGAPDPVAPKDLVADEQAGVQASLAKSAADEKPQPIKPKYRTGGIR